ncbi:MAG: adenylate/guanylate cyclase domain-containing protein [Spirochaetes bacterium]|nr:adenylate/guanylate cyclase domain-containing protein [Spirochaetota bacterium]
MLNFFKFNKHNVIGLLVSMIMFMLIAFSYKNIAIFDGFEKRSVSFLFFMRDPFEKPKQLGQGAKLFKKNPRANDAILILGMDEDTLREFNGMGINWPFPRDVHAKFIDFVSTGDPAAILMDIMFLEQKPGDNVLAESIKKSGKVFLDYPFEIRAADTKYDDINDRMAILNEWSFDLDPADNQIPWVEEALPPTPMFAKSAAGLGYANVLPDETDHVNRMLPVILKFQGRYYPSIDLVVAMHYYGITKKDVEIKIGKYVKLKNIPPDKLVRKTADNSITIPIDKRGFMNINFIGSHGSFQEIPYFYFYGDGEIGNDSIKDKIILVASYAVTGIAEDTHDSPYGKTFGIEHHANALNTIINQDFLYNLSFYQNLLIMFLIAIILGFFMPRIKILVSIIVTVVIAAGYIIAAYLFFDLNNYIIALSTPLIQIGFTFTAIIAFRLLTEQKEKKMIRSTFSKFVSKSVVDELLKHPEKVKLGGDKKIITVLFSDVRGFTSISERLTAEKLVEHLNEYLQAMTDIVIASFGTLDKYVGDELMAFWGAPIPQDDHHLRACKAAIEMMQVLGRLNQHWNDTGKPPLDIGIGINTGDMVVGNMGSNSRMDYTIMGDNVNLGARLEGTNKVYGTNIIISEYTYEYVKEHVFARELDLIRVKGKEKPVKIYELIDVIS